MSATEIPGYKIIRTLGVGGQATVYLAIQKGFDRKVALKVMSPALAADPSFGERFLSEAKIVADLSHKSIVTVYDVGESGNFYYLAMEYLPGGDLKSRISEGIKTRDCLAITQKLSLALDFAHQQGYIHRDVKSENILFNRQGEPLLTDFGIAKASNSSSQLTQAGKLIGTPDYMSPEQCRGKPLDGRSDLYSLGIIFFEMLCRRVPYSGEDSVAICIQHVTQPVPQLPARLKHLQWLLDSLLAKDPVQRFQTGNQLAKALVDYEKQGGQTQQNSTHRTTISPAIQANKKTAHQGFDSRVAEPQEFDELHTERRYVAVEPETKSSFAKIILFLLLVGAGAAGYLYKESWLPQSQVWIANLLNQQGSSSQQSKLEKSKNNQSRESIAQKSSVTPEQMLSEADTLLQFTPKRLEDVKKALKLVLIVRSSNPKNNNAELIYQNILNICLTSASEKSDLKDFNAAENWLAVVTSEAPNHPLLAMTRKSVAQAKQNVSRSQTKPSEKQQLLSQLLSDGERALSENRLSSPQKDNAISYFNQALKIEPQNRAALEGLKQVEVAYQKLIEQAVKSNSYAKAKAYLARYNGLSSDDNLKLMLRQKILLGEKAYSEKQTKRKLQAAQQKQAQEAEAARLTKLNDPLVQMRLLGSLDSAATLEATGDLVKPAGNNALLKYRSVLEIDERNQQAIEGIKRIEKSILDALTNNIAAMDKAAAQTNLTHLMLFQADHPQLNSFQLAVDEMIEPLPTDETEQRESLEDESNSPAVDDKQAADAVNQIPKNSNSN